MIAVACFVVAAVLFALESVAVPTAINLGSLARGFACAGLAAVAWGGL